jgi:hypothetical protein
MDGNLAPDQSLWSLFSSTNRINVPTVTDNRFSAERGQ